MDAGDHEESLPVALEELVPNNNAPAEKTGAQAEGSSPNPQTVLTKTVVLQGGCEGDLGQMAQDGGGSPAGRVSAASKAPPQPWDLAQSSTSEPPTGPQSKNYEISGRSCGSAKTTSETAGITSET